MDHMKSHSDWLKDQLAKTESLSVKKYLQKRLKIALEDELKWGERMRGAYLSWAQKYEQQENAERKLSRAPGGEWRYSAIRRSKQLKKKYIALAKEAEAKMVQIRAELTNI